MSRRRRMLAAAAVAGLAAVGWAVPAGSAERTDAIFVPAAAGWTDSGVVVGVGTTVSATGQAITIAPVNPVVGQASQWQGHSGPDGQPFACASFVDVTGAHPCLIEGAPYGALVGRVGADVFVIGSWVAIGHAGELWLGVNDNQDFGIDNIAGYAVHID
jgi:hypothetical protein